jgi:hypothetical protein
VLSCCREAATKALEGVYGAGVVRKCRSSEDSLGPFRAEQPLLMDTHAHPFMFTQYSLTLQCIISNLPTDFASSSVNPCKVPRTSTVENIPWTALPRRGP